MAKYHLIKHSIEAQISRGELRSGDQIMPVRMLMREHNASYATVSKALAQLSEAGLVQQVWGKGIFVCESSAPSKNLAVTFDSVYDITHPYLAGVLHGLGEAARRDNWQIQICPLPNGGIYGGDPEVLLARMLREGYIGGVIVCSAHPPADIRRLGEMGIPAVTVNLEYSNATAVAVMPDIADGVQQVLDHLQALGHERIGLVMGRNVPHSAQVKMASSALCDRFRIAMRDRGLPFRAEWLIYSDHRWEVAQPRIAALLESSRRPTAMVFISDLLALPAIELAESMGLSVPGDLSVVTWGDSHHERLTRARIDLHEVGQQAFAQIQEIIRSASRKNIHVPVRLMAGETTALAPTESSLAVREAVGMSGAGPAAASSHR